MGMGEKPVSLLPHLNIEKIHGNFFDKNIGRIYNGILITSRNILVSHCYLKRDTFFALKRYSTDILCINA